jgi:N-acetylglucosaminyl-diphospho-decaprenol L-rhamnosyltransferase
MSSTSVVIVSYHTGEVLYAALASVLMQHDLAELVLVDNGNPPDVIARLQQMSLMDSRFKVLTGHGNIGFAAACNLGAKQATGEYLLLLNPDCILPPRALTIFMREMNVLPNTMLAGAHMVNPDGSEQRGGRRSRLTPMVALGEVVGLRKLNHHRTPMPTETHDVQAISGACMCIRKADYNALGGLDEGYFLHVEDLDLCMRVAKAGKRIVCIPAVRIAHLLSTSGQVSASFIEQHKAKGFVRYFQKHFGEKMFPGMMYVLKAAIWGRYYLRRMRPHKFQRAAVASRKLIVLSGSLTLRQNAGVLTGKTVLVTGATSQIGVFVIKHLLSAGVAVLAVSRDVPLPFAHPNLKWLRMDITKDDFSLGGYLADVAIHCAPQWTLPKILPVLAESEVKNLVAIGSTSVFSKASSANAFEKDLVAKHARAEQDIAAICAERNIGWTILRPTMIYGVGLDRNITSVTQFIQRFGFFPLYPPAMGRRQPVHAEDVAIATLQVLNSSVANGRTYNISGGEIITYRAMIERIFTTLGKKVKIIETTLLPAIFQIGGIMLNKPHITRDMAYRMNEDLMFFHDDAARDFDYRPRAFLSGGKADIEGVE